MKKITFFLAFPALLQAQFDPAAGQAGSLAIHKDAAVFVGWATGCTAERGWKDISQSNLGYTTSGAESYTLGQAGEGGTLSLGDGGQAVLTFASPIRNGQGADFAVFENAFSDTFLELAFVEVSSDGQHFVRFPAISNTPVEMQVGSFGAVDATHLYNLAGKYSANYGTPFDLEELKDSMDIDVEHITHIRIVDVVGCIQPQFARYDSRGIAINEPWTTPFAEGGFDLDAIGVIHSATNSAITQPMEQAAAINIYPNPIGAGEILNIETTTVFNKIYLYNALGQCIMHNNFINKIEIPQHLNTGIYWLVLENERGISTIVLNI